MKTLFRFIFLSLTVLFYACTSSNDDAKSRLDMARVFYTNKNYTLAKLEIDSLNILYPKAIDERKAGIVLLDSIRRSENADQITLCDSLITSKQPLLDSLKSLFIYQIDKEYQEEGVYIPKESVTGGRLTATTLRSGVEEKGQLYIESVFVGGSQRHNKIKVTTKGGLFVESLPVTDDGFNYRFSNLNMQYEVIKFVGDSENGISKFIAANMNNPLSITLEGKSNYTYSLSNSLKAAVNKSVLLSDLILEIDSLQTKKEEAEYKNYYLENKGNVLETPLNKVEE